jgi:hypothetical protein
MAYTPPSDLEFGWFATRSGLVNNKSLLDHKVAYFTSKGFGAPSKPITQMEHEWLASLTPNAVTARHEGDLWREACIAQGAPVGESITECKNNFFSHVSGSP